MQPISPTHSHAELHSRTARCVLAATSGFVWNPSSSVFCEFASLRRRAGVASFPGPLREFRTASDERAGPGNEASAGELNEIL